MAAVLLDPQQVWATIEEMVRRIVERFQPERIILFGSQARRTAGPDSDVDLLVVMPVAEDRKRELRLAIRGALSDLPIAKDIIVVTPQQAERYGHLVGTIIHPALREGTVLYERAA